MAGRPATCRSGAPAADARGARRLTKPPMIGKRSQATCAESRRLRSCWVTASAPPTAPVDPRRAARSLAYGGRTCRAATAGLGQPPRASLSSRTRNVGPCGPRSTEFCERSRSGTPDPTSARASLRMAGCDQASDAAVSIEGAADDGEQGRVAPEHQVGRRTGFLRRLARTLPELPAWRSSAAKWLRRPCHGLNHRHVRDARRARPPRRTNGTTPQRARSRLPPRRQRTLQSTTTRVLSGTLPLKNRRLTHTTSRPTIKRA